MSSSLKKNIRVSQRKKEKKKRKKLINLLIMHCFRKLFSIFVALFKEPCLGVFEQLKILFLLIPGFFLVEAMIFKTLFCS